MKILKRMVRRFSRFAAIFGASASVAALHASDPVVIPDVGVDMPGMITAIGTALGAIVVAALTMGAAFILVRKGWRWVRGNQSG